MIHEIEIISWTLNLMGVSQRLWSLPEQWGRGLILHKCSKSKKFLNKRQTIFLWRHVLFSRKDSFKELNKQRYLSEESIIYRKIVLADSGELYWIFLELRLWLEGSLLKISLIILDFNSILVILKARNISTKDRII